MVVRTTLALRTSVSNVIIVSYKKQVGPQHILTAGHCLHEVQSPRSIKVILGTSSIVSSRSGQSFGAIAFGVHPNFNSDLIKADVALIKLDKPVQMDEVNGIRTACLPTVGSVVPSNRLCIVSGFGTNNGKGRGGGSGEMRYTVLQKQADSSCSIYGPYDPSVSVRTVSCCSRHRIISVETMLHSFPYTVLCAGSSQRPRYGHLSR